MKYILSISLILLSCFSINAQRTTFVNFNITADTLQLRHYKLEKDSNPDIKTLKVEVKFNDETIISPKDLEILNDGTTQVIAVDYVFTQYNDRQSQENLNKKRLLELYLTSPNIFTQKMTCWRFVEQLGFTKDKDASLLFHGFVIKYRKITPYRAASPEVVKKDIIRKMTSTDPNAMGAVFKRNPKLPKELIVADYTCSMSPYYIELMAWFCLQDFKSKSSFAFFNDGDGISNDKKVIGRTGGIHQFKTNSLDTIAKYIYETVKFGCSGDEPENDLEAVLKGIEKNKKVKEVVLIADNWSDVRDIRLKHLITKPVHIILCGTEHGINPQYLDLARKTKGSVHTMTEDLEELFKLSEGQRFSLAGHEFQIQRGQIVLVNKT